MSAMVLDRGLWLYQGVTETARPRVLARHVAGLLGCTPAEVSFRRDFRGKPYLARPQVPFAFSVAHRYGLLVIAALPKGPVGCDLELMDEGAVEENDLVARQFFSTAEQAWLASLGGGARTRGFLGLWTAKEAMLKAEGLGIAEALASADLGAELAPGQGLPDGFSDIRCGGALYAIGYYSIDTKEGPVLVAFASPKTCPIC